MNNNTAKPKTISTEHMRLKTSSIVLAIGLTAFILASLFWNLYEANNHVKEIAKSQARISFNKDRATRMWATKRGGVYVPMNERTPGNPYLDHIPYRDILHPDGTKLTLMNPAYMIRQMFDEFPKEYGVVGRIVSLKPLNPNNAPDEWERKALLSFEKGTKEVFEFVHLNGKEYLRLIQPMITEKGCLKCHGHQGYKVGNVRGGVGVSVPMEPLWVMAENEEKRIIIVHLIFLVIGYIGIVFGFMVIERGVTKRKQAEGELNKLSMAVAQSPVSIVITDTDGKIEYVNPKFMTLTGYSLDEVIGQNPSILKLGEHPDSYYKNIWTTINSGKTWAGEFHNQKKNGESYWESAKISPIFNDSGNITQYLAVKEDITELKKAEEEKVKMQAQLTQAQKMESVGRLAGGVAHDFNNMLGVILGHTEMLLEQVEPGQAIHEDLTEIRKAAERSADLTRQLLAFARKQTVSPKVLDLNKTVDSMLMMLKRLIGENIELAWFPGKNLGLVNIDPSQIDQILANLCVNARDAIADVGKIIIETGNVIFDENYCSENPGFIPGEFVLLAVSDDGGGMDQKTLDQVFEPFFTTKELGKGTGLGLSTVYGIVKQNNGFINAYSELTQGTAFKIYLPRHIGKNEQILKNGSPEPDMRGHETILLVEDEPAILNMTKIMLERMGYHVLTANSPGEAMRLAEINAGQIHLLMTDVVMPKMNGRDLAKNILALYPNLKCLFMSGYTANVIAHQGVLDEGTYFIQKPFSKKDLAVMVRSALE